MSVHSYSRCWLHLIWGTLNRQRLLNKAAAARVSPALTEYAESKGIYMKINHVNADHVHALVDLPTGFSIEELVQLLKGSSSHWINSNDLITGKFAWGRGVWRVLRLAIKCRPRGPIHRRPGGASPHPYIRRGAQRIY